jgi:AcrR family transcriptional regulator
VPAGMILRQVAALDACLCVWGVAADSLFLRIDRAPRNHACSLPNGRFGPVFGLDIKRSEAVRRERCDMSNKKVHSLQRLLEIAADEFCCSRYEDVSVAKISKLAHCSTATIYDIYSSKDELFRCSMLLRLEQSWPGIPPVDGSPALLGLLCFFENRLRQLSSMRGRRLTAAVVAQRAIIGEEFLAELQRQRAIVGEVMARFVENAVEEGSMVAAVPASVGYLLLAACSYESVLYGLTFGVDYSIDYEQVIRSSFEPFLTPKGLSILDAHLCQVQMPFDVAA